MREIARKDKEVRFTALLHHADVRRPACGWPTGRFAHRLAASTRTGSGPHSVIVLGLRRVARWGEGVFVIISAVRS